MSVIVQEQQIVIQSESETVVIVTVEEPQINVVVSDEIDPVFQASEAYKFEEGDKQKLDDLSEGADLSNYFNKTTDNLDDVEEGSTKKSVTQSEKDTWNGKQNNLGFTPENSANKDQASGYAGLDSEGKINPSQLPALAIGNTFVVASQSAMLLLDAQQGDLAVRTDLNKTFILTTADPTTLANWQELLTPTDAVASIFGRTGAVTAQNGDYNTGQVTEVTDKKYVTDAEKTKIGNSFDKTADDLDDISEGSTNKHFTGTEKTKLAGIETGADVTDAGNVGSSIHGATGKTTPVDADTIPTIDSEASNVLKKVTWTNIKSFLKTYFDGLYQVLDSDLTTIAGLSPSNDDILQRKSGNWINRTMAQLKSDLGLVKGDVGLGNVDNTSDATKASAVATYTNKRITARVGTVASHATPTINTDDYDMFTITALATAITSMTTNLSGTPTSGQKLIIRIKDDGTARGITWGASFRASSDLALPTTTTLGKTMYTGFIWNSTDSKWDLIAKLDNF